MTGTGTRAGTRMGMALVVAGAGGAGAAYAAAIVTGAAPAWAPWLLAAGSTAASVGLFVLGAASRGALTRGVRAGLIGLFLLMLGAWAAALWLPDATADEPVVFGLPLRLAIVFYGIGFVPLFALPLLHAWTARHDDVRGTRPEGVS